MAPIGQTGIRLDPTLRAFDSNSDAIRSSTIRLGTGNRILENGDDSASLSAATALQTQNSTLRSSLRNGARATTLLQIAREGLSQIRSILDGLNGLTATANGSGLTPRQFALLDAQFQSKKSTIDTVVAATRYSGANLLDGTFSGGGAAPFQLNDVTNSDITVTIPSVTSASLFATPTNLSDTANAASAATDVANARELVDDAIAKIGAYQSRLDTAEAATRRTIRGVGSAIDNLLATDTTQETNALTRTTLQQQTATAVLAQALGINSNLLALVR